MTEINELEIAARIIAANNRIVKRGPIMVVKDDPAPKALGKKIGVWINGKLALQTRNRDTCDDLAAKAMRNRDSVWVAPIGSFETE